MNGDDAPESMMPIDSALAQLIANGPGAAAQARALLADSGTAPELLAGAEALLALYEFREGTAQAGHRHVERGFERLACGTPPPWIRWLVELAQAMGARRDGALELAEQILVRLHEQSTRRTPVQAFFSATALGTVLSMRGDSDRALELYYQALGLARMSGVASLLVNALNNLGSYQSDLHNLEDARPLLEECLRIALTLGSRRQLIFAAGNLSQCLCVIGDAPAALAVVREHLLQQIRPDDPPALQRDEEIAQAFLDNGMVEPARDRLRGPVHVDPLSNEMSTARAWLLARISLESQRPAEALAICRERRAALLRTEERGTVAADQLNLLRIHSQAAAAVGDFAEAFDRLSDAYAAHELLVGRAARARRSSLQIVHRLEQAERERDRAQQVAADLEALNASLRAQAAENERLQARLRSQAFEDSLTALPNRRHLFDAGMMLLELAERRADHLSLAVIDLDQFKSVNDVHGHDAGDQALRAFADLMRSETRGADLVCRYGGEEFVVLLPGADADQATRRLESMLQRYRTTPVAGRDGETFYCSFSAGVAEAREQGYQLPLLLSLADKALYQAKAEGRARVCAQALVMPAQGAAQG